MQLAYSFEQPDVFELMVYSSADLKQRNSVVIRSDSQVLIIDPSNDDLFVNSVKDIIGKKECWLLYSH